MGERPVLHNPEEEPNPRGAGSVEARVSWLAIDSEKRELRRAVDEVSRMSPGAYYTEFGLRNVESTDRKGVVVHANELDALHLHANRTIGSRVVSLCDPISDSDADYLRRAGAREPYESDWSRAIDVLNQVRAGVPVDQINDFGESDERLRTFAKVLEIERPHANLRESKRGAIATVFQGDVVDRFSEFWGFFLEQQLAEHHKQQLARKGDLRFECDVYRKHLFMQDGKVGYVQETLHPGVTNLRTAYWLTAASNGKPLLLRHVSGSGLEATVAYGKVMSQQEHSLSKDHRSLNHLCADDKGDGYVSRPFADALPDTSTLPFTLKGD